MNRTVKPEKFSQNFLSPTFPIYQCHLPSQSASLQASIQLRTGCRPLNCAAARWDCGEGEWGRCEGFTEEVYERLWLQTWAGKVLSLNFCDLINSTNCKLISLWVANWLLGLTNFWGQWERTCCRHSRHGRQSRDCATQIAHTPRAPRPTDVVEEVASSE